MDGDAIMTSRRARSAALTVLIAVAASSCESKDTVPTRQEAPVENPYPTKLVHLRGHIDPSLSIEVTTQYASSSPKCRRTMDWMEGASSPIAVWHDESVHRVGDQYEAEVALDRYQPGPCHWYPFVIGFLIRHEDGLATGHFEGTEQGTKHIDGPESVIWVDVPGKGDPLFKDPANKGFGALAPFELACKETVERGAKGLWCEDPEAQRHRVPLITEEATEVNVDVRD